MNNIFILNIRVNKKSGYPDYIDGGIFYTLEEAIQNGIDSLNVYYKNNNRFIKNKDKFFKNKDYYFSISIISTNRKRFNTSKELMDYFNTNIKNISNDNLYDFLLSLVVSDDRFYDYKGKLITSAPQKQYPKLESYCSSIVQFSMESCEIGYYKFCYY